LSWETAQPLPATDQGTVDDDFAVDDGGTADDGTLVDAGGDGDGVPRGQGGNGNGNTPDKWWLFGLVFGLVFGLFILVVLLVLWRRSKLNSTAYKRTWADSTKSTGSGSAGNRTYHRRDSTSADGDFDIFIGSS
jgi:hypothetical protein